jgi:hypothetical protein
MHRGGKALVNELRSALAGDDIAVGSVADRCLLSGVKQTSHFKGVRTVFDPTETLVAPNGPVPETGFEPLSMRSIKPV